MRKKVLLAMSGGVDSTAAAVILLRAGYDVTGVTMLLWRDHQQQEAQESLRKKAEHLARHLGIPHVCCDLTESFYQKVVTPFMEGYRHGETPNPCLLCNRQFKFSLLLDSAEKALEEKGYGSQNFDFFATGHYARVITDQQTGEAKLYRAKDPSKDQSYVLYALGQSMLRRVLFPLGDYTKKEARAIAESAGIEIPPSEESQDICFVSGTYDQLLRENGGLGYPGWFVDLQGQPLAPHQGIARYTIGQRNKLGVALGKKMSVVAIHPETLTVQLGEESELFQTELSLKQVSWTGSHMPSFPLAVQYASRYRQPLKEGVVICRENRYFLQTSDPQRGACPGQAAVFYQGDQVLGGGTIQAEPSTYPDQWIQTEKCPAKINLSLEIGEKDQSPLHPIRTIMQTVDWGDTVTLFVQPREKAAVHYLSNDPTLSGDQNNLAVKAAYQWLQATGAPWEITLGLIKRIPQGAGLGGGSSDAAGVLRALQKIAEKHPSQSPRPLTQTALQKLAFSLGSDVPFFLSDGRALVTGYGEQIQPILSDEDFENGSGKGTEKDAESNFESTPDAAAPYLLLLCPHLAVSTAEAYAWLDEARQKGVSPQPLASEWNHLITNDFHSVIPTRYPQIQNILDELGKTNPVQFGLSGSGAACFGLYTSRGQQKQAQRILEGAFNDTVLVLDTRFTR